METTAWISLVSYLPALQDLRLPLNAPLIKDELGCLLEALALCPRLRALDLSTLDAIYRRRGPGRRRSVLALP